MASKDSATAKTLNLNKIIYFTLALRPYQWTKNLLVFAAIIFSGNILNLYYLEKTIFTFVLFCIASGSIYVINDIVDRREDAFHPEKKDRPIAAGLLNVKFAAVGAVLLIITAIGGSFLINTQLGLIIGVYILLICSYSFKLKHVVILDLLIVAVGFVLRAIAGGVAIRVFISPWLLVCTFFLALFLVIGKRRHELHILQQNAGNHRKILKEYNLRLLDQMVAVVAATTIVAYALYTLDQVTVDRFHTTNLIYTIPFVILGIFRYFYLIYIQETGSRPEKLLVTDNGIILAILGWLVTVGIIIY